MPIKTSLTLILLAFWLLRPWELCAQSPIVTLSGTIQQKASREAVPFVHVALKKLPDSTLVTGTITNEDGLFTLPDVKPGEYLLEASYLRFTTYTKSVFVGTASPYLDLGIISLEENVHQLNEVVVAGQQDAVSEKLDKQTYSLEANLSQSGGSVLQAMQNLPGITVQDGQLHLRGNPQVMVLMDGKQTALTGFGNQNGLDNMPASAVAKIEIIHNPSAKYDANGNAGIINIILKKEEQRGLNGKVGLTTGLGALWVRQTNLPGIRPQYRATPKINPSVSLNYRKDKVNLFLQADNLYTQTLNKNEFVTRSYQDGTLIEQQLKRNRNTNFFSSRAGVDWFLGERNTVTVSGLFSRETIIDRGDQPFFTGDRSVRVRLWQFLEDEILTVALASTAFQHRFTQPGHQLNLGFNYSFDREDEKYFFDNTLPTYSSKESFALLADQQVADLTLDYIRPLKQGRLETGIKFRRRTIPTHMQFFPGVNSPLDPEADGKATYQETIPAVYGNYTYQTKKLEAELGLRVEYVRLRYEVDPSHNTYTSDGYAYFQPFPTTRLTYHLDEHHKLSAFYHRRVQRPDEVDIRIFPKYDDAEIIKVGNPALRPQFSNTLEVGYKYTGEKGYYYTAAYRRRATGTITRISTTVAGSRLIYNTFQNVGKSHNTGMELVLSRTLSERLSLNVNVNGYYNQIDAYRVVNLYPVENTFSAAQQQILSGSAKVNALFRAPGAIEAQVTAIYLAPDVIPQGRIAARFSLDAGIKKEIQQGKGELTVNASDLLNTMVIRKTINGKSFRYISSDYYETQVIRGGYSYKF